MIRIIALFFTGTLSLVLNNSAFAQGSYTDQNTDGVYLYTDLYGDPYYTAPQTCPAYTSISSAFNNQSGFDSVYYPNTAVISLNAPANKASEPEYAWQQEVQHFGQQRGGNCGAITDVIRTTYLSIAVTAGDTISDDGHGNCKTKADCTGGVTPLCPGTGVTPKTWTVVEGSSPCDPFHWSYFLTYRTSKTLPRSCVSSPGLAVPIPYTPAACDTQ